MDANNFLKANPSLEGESLLRASEGRSWDAPVQALTQFPSVLNTLASNITWTSALGDASATQQEATLAAVQRMRAKAYAAGNLKTGKEIKVVQESPQVIVIQPANPQVVYVPSYNPTVVYGAPVTTPGYSTGGVGGCFRSLVWRWRGRGCRNAQLLLRLQLLGMGHELGYAGPSPAAAAITMAILTGEAATIPVITPDIGLLFTRHHVHPIRVIVRLTIRQAVGLPPTGRRAVESVPLSGVPSKTDASACSSSYNIPTTVPHLAGPHDACARTPAYSGSSAPKPSTKELRGYPQQTASRTVATSRPNAFSGSGGGRPQSARGNRSMGTSRKHG